MGVLYLDALFKIKDKSGLWSVDDPGIKDIPPFNLDIAAVATATSEGNCNVRCFDANDPALLLTELCTSLNAMPYDTRYVGWYIDQVIIPSICANAFIYNINSRLPKWLRYLDDKWTKTFASSVDRAFFQGWYPSDKSKAPCDLTLRHALEICKLEIPEADPRSTESRLLARLIGINRLYVRYNDILRR